MCSTRGQEPEPDEVKENVGQWADTVLNMYCITKYFFILNMK